MSLTWRRAVAARGLLSAAAAVALAATLLLAGLAGFGQRAIADGVRSAVAAAPPADRSILVRGASRTAPVAAQFARGLAGRPVTVRAAGYASGWAVAGTPSPASVPGAAVPGEDGVVYADVVTLEDLPAHATLVAGSWPSGGAVALAEPAATALGARAGGTMGLVDRRTGNKVVIGVSGVWRPLSVDDPYWLLTPDVFGGRVARTATYGPIAVDRATFDRSFSDGASAGWIAAPDLGDATLAQVDAVAQAAVRAKADLPAATGLGASATVTTGLGDLRDRLDRAALVGRSALVTPMLLVVVLGGYTLLLVASLLTEARRGETALLRARGAGRLQLAGLAVRESLLVVLPAAVIALALQVAGLSWPVAILAALAGAAALTVPALRKGRTFLADTASRPRRSLVQRAGLDLLLIVLAVLGWLQLRQYSSPIVAGSLGIDPLLAAAPTLGVLTGAVLAVRLLPPLAKVSARRLDRGTGVPAMLGAWQAARRSQAGPMVLLALAVAAATVSWCLAATARQSLADQAALQVGADQRLVGGASPAGLPGVRAAVPLWRDTLSMENGGGDAHVVAVDAATASSVVSLRSDLAGADLWRRLATSPSYGKLNDGKFLAYDAATRTTAILADGTRADLGVSTGRPKAFAGSGVALAGYIVDPGERAVRWHLDGLPADWQGVEPDGTVLTASADGFIHATGPFAVVPPAATGPVPIAATPEALSGLRLAVGQQGTLPLGGTDVPIQVVTSIAAVPGAGGRAALLVDLPTLSARLLGAAGIVASPQEWLVSGHLSAAPAGPSAASSGLSVAPNGSALIDRQAVIDSAGRDPFGEGSRTALFVAAVGAALLAAAGIAIDVQATTRRRSASLAVLHTLGAGPRLLARSMLVEQGFLAGLGVTTGLAAGLLVAAAMAPRLILTPAAERPLPVPLLHVDWLPVAATAAFLLVLALSLSAVAAASAGRRLPAARLHAGADR